ncbi:hypothetical protein BCR34DRAFT_75513 [Clohesyomyces aquaticus]|uniref:Uncharacterized protein n=1 Tax=Clohesyomyces aquaticus TaxID=1231657 RepID=A0A1Y2A396_9PLEO|nr:hypothetical protein BCR34DRAFT_75513 [Clohesyomyces aquaticus]
MDSMESGGDGEVSMTTFGEKGSRSLCEDSILSSFADSEPFLGAKHSRSPSMNLITAFQSSKRRKALKSTQAGDASAAGEVLLGDLEERESLIRIAAALRMVKINCVEEMQTSKAAGVPVGKGPKENMEDDDNGGHWRPKQHKHGPVCPQRYSDGGSRHRRAFSISSRSW